MYKSFSDLDAVIESLKTKGDLFSVMASIPDAYNQLSSVLSSTTDEYARAYSQVQQTQYDGDGNLQDVTNPARLTVPNTVLAAARNELRNAKSKLNSHFPVGGVTVPLSVVGEITPTIGRYQIMVLGYSSAQVAQADNPYDAWALYEIDSEFGTGSNKYYKRVRASKLGSNVTRIYLRVPFADTCVIMPEVLVPGSISGRYDVVSVTNTFKAYCAVSIDQDKVSIVVCADQIWGTLRLPLTVDTAPVNTVAYFDVSGDVVGDYRESPSVPQGSSKPFLHAIDFSVGSVPALKAPEVSIAVSNETATYSYADALRALAGEIPFDEAIEALSFEEPGS